MQRGSDPLKSTAELGYLEPNRVCNNGRYSEVSPELLCCICQNVFWKPVACANCQNSFCANCIQTWINKQDSIPTTFANQQNSIPTTFANQQYSFPTTFTNQQYFIPTTFANQPNLIPTKCPFNCVFLEKRAPPILNNFLSKLQIYCAYAPNGCNEVLPYDGLEKHEQECQYERTPCRICEAPVSHRDQNNKHELRQCFNEMYNRNPDHVQAQFMKLLDVVEASQQRIQALEKLLGIEP